MRQRVLSLIIALLGIAAGAQADNLKVGGVELIPGETYTSESGIPALKSGKIIYTEDKVVILENVTLTTYEEKGMDCSVWPELTITLVGNNTIQGATNGIYTERSLNINGTGTLHISECTYGIDNNDMPLTITDAHIKTEGYRLGMRRAGMLHMEGCAILETRGGEGYESIGNISGIDGEGFCITTPEGGKVKDNYVVDASDDIVKNSWVVIQKKIAINETTFPDANFRSHILAQTYGKDGYLTSEELAGVSYMSLSNKNISNLKGIEHFTALETMACNGNQLASLDVSKQAALILLDCSSNKLTAIDVSQNKKLTELNCSDNELTTLDVTENKALTNLDCAKNQLSVIYVSDDVPLVSLNISKNMMREWYMDVLLNNLYNRYGMENGKLFVCDDEAATGNMMTPDQVAAAKAKGWIPMINDGGWNSYNGALPIDETNFPDENFRNWILAQDYGSDGYLTDAEIADVKKIEVEGKNIASLMGIEYFTALEEVSCYNNELTSLDLSKNTALKKLICVRNKLTTLDLSKNTALTELECHINQFTTLDFSQNTALEKLVCSENPLTSLNVSNNISLKVLNCNQASLTTLEISGNINLTQLQLIDNQLTSLDLSKNTSLVSLMCDGNQLTTLDLSKNTKLAYLNCSRNAIRGEGMNTLVNSLFDRTALPSGTLCVYEDETPAGNEITTLQVAVAKAKNWKVLMNDGSDWVDYAGVKVVVVNEENFPDEKFRNWILAQEYGKDGYLTDTEIAAVKSISVWNKDIANMKGIELFTALTNLDCSNNQLKELDISMLTNLTQFDCSNNQLNMLDVSNNGELGVLNCGNNQLTTLDLSKNSKLFSLSCPVNKLTTLDMSKNPELGTLFCAYNQLTSLHFSNDPKLSWVQCYGNAIRGEGMETLVNSLNEITGGDLEVYDADTPDGNEMNSVQVAIAKAKGWNVLKSDGSDYEGVPVGLAIDETTFPDANFRSHILAQTYGKDGYLTDEEIAAVTTINVPNKNIANLKGIEIFTALTYLDCSNNQLTALDVSKNTALTDLNFFDNHLATLDVSKNTALITLRCYNNQLTSLDMSKNIALKYLFCSNNQLTALDVSKNTALKELWCYQNAIRGENMTTFVNSLPVVSDGNMNVYFEETSTGNEMTALQVAAAKVKGWNVQMYNGSYWEEYTGTMLASGIAFSAATADATYGTDFTAPTLTVTPESLKSSVTFTSSNETVAKVSASGKVTIVGIGEATITAKFAGDDTYNGAEASYKLTVSPGTATMAFKSTECSTTVAATFNSPELTTTPASLKVKYSSSNTDLATVNEETGAVVAKAKGEVTITATCADPNYTGSTSYKLTIALNESGLQYANTTATVTYGADFTAPTLTNPNALSVTYKSSNTDVATVNSTTGVVTIAGAGTAEISAEFAGNATYKAATVSYTLTVAKAVPVVTAPVAVANLIANGTEQPLVTAGSTTGGEMQYSRDGSTWSTAIPTVAEAGTYTVYYKVVGDRNYEDVATTSLKVTMARATATGLTFSSPTAEAVYGAAFTAPTLRNPKALTVTYNSSDADVATVDAETGAVTIVGAGTAVINAVFAGNGTYEAVTVSYTLTVAKAVPTVTAPVAIDNLTATGEAQPLVTAGTTTGGEMQYSLDGTTWSTAIPTATDAGTYTIYYKVVGDNNHEDVAAKTLTVTIAKASATGLAFSSATAEATYGGSFTAPTLSNPKSLAVTYSSNDTEVATVDAETGAVTIVGAGTAVINAVFAGNGTYEAVTVSYTLTVAKAVPTVTAPVAIDDLTADGSALALITAGTTTGGEMQYSLDGTAWSTDIPTATEAGTYTVYYQVVGGRNYEDVAAQSVSVTVAASSVVDDDVEVGDANGDGTINAADIVEVVNYIMGHPSEKFKAKGADANEDGTVNAADIVKIVNMIMAKSRMRMGAFGWEDTGVEDVFDDSAEPAIFDLQGHRLDSLRKGVNIIRDEHGRTKKIFVK